MSQFIEMFGDPMTNTKTWVEFGYIGNYTQIVLGTTPNSKNSSYWNGEIKWITPAEMTEESYYIYDTERHLTEEGLKAANLTLLPCRSVLFSTRAPIGKVGLVGSPMYCNQGFKNFVCGDQLNPVYLYYSLIFKREYLVSLGTGTTFKELSKKAVENLKIAVPPLILQNKFEEIYQQADKSKFGDFKSQFIEMFGNCKSQGTLSSLCATFIDGDWIESKDQSDNGIRLIQTGNVGFGFFKGREDKSRYITEETFKKLNCTEVVPGDILISRLPDPIGRACIVPEGIGKAITAVDCTIVRLNATLLPEFLISFSKTALYASQINKIKTGTTRLRVSRGNLGNVIIPIPPIESQHHFAAIAQQADKSKSVIQKALVYLNDIQSDELGKIA